MMRAKKAYRWLVAVAVVAQLVLAVPATASPGCSSPPEQAQAMMPVEHHHGTDDGSDPQADTCDCHCLAHLTCTMPIPAVPNVVDFVDLPPPDAARSPTRLQPTLAAHGRRLERPPA